MIVVDTNLIAYLHIEGEKTVRARQVLERDGAWAAPFLWRSEMRNVVVRTVRAAGLSAADAWVAVAAAEDLMRGREFLPSSERVLDLALESQASPYDCEFVAVAEMLRVPLVTNDRRLTKAFPERALTLDAYLAG